MEATHASVGYVVEQSVVDVLYSVLEEVATKAIQSMRRRLLSMKVQLPLFVVF